MIAFLKKIFGGRPIFYSVVILSFLAGFFLKSIIFPSFQSDGSKKEDCLSDLTFINPEPGCELYESKLDAMTSLQSVLESQIKGYIKDGKASRVSVFSRDLVSKKFAGVNEAEIFFMASLLKVPLAIAYYRIAETTPGSLAQEVFYSGKPDLYSSQSVIPKDKLMVNHKYSVSDLLYKALANSDNTAAEILSEHISEDYLERTLVAIGLEAIRNGEREDLVTAKTYANVFRILYNASFISRGYSNEILKTLTEGSYTEGAIKKLPKDTIVAHKFGERSMMDRQTGKATKRQLHDCGIVYAKSGKEPYTFCILTEGTDFSDLQSILQDISLTIYNELVK